RRRMSKIGTWISGAVAIAAAIFAGIAADAGGFSGLLVLGTAIVAGFGAYMLLLWLVFSRRIFTLQGHAQGCDALTGAVEFRELEGQKVRFGYRLYFGNNAFVLAVMSRTVSRG